MRPDGGALVSLFSLLVNALFTYLVSYPFVYWMIFSTLNYTLSSNIAQLKIDSYFNQILKANIVIAFISSLGVFGIIMLTRYLNKYHDANLLIVLSIAIAAFVLLSVLSSMIQIDFCKKHIPNLTKQVKRKFLLLVTISHFLSVAFILMILRANSG